MQDQKNQETEKEQNNQGQGSLGASPVSTDNADEAGAIDFSKNLQGSRAEKQVRENEDASLQDDTYAFDSDNTGNEYIHDVSDFEGGSEEDYIQ